MKKQVAEKKISANLSRKLISLDNIMVAVCSFTNGPMKEADPPHSHPHEQITYVAEGELIFYIGDEEFHNKKGDLLAIPSGVKHCIKTVSEKVELVDSFSPVREDFLK